MISTAEVKWIKIVTDIFDNQKIKQIEALPSGDSILVIWFKILCLSGNTNENGLMMLSHDIPYTDEMLSTEFRRPLNTIKMALGMLERLGMIEIIDNIYHVSNWEKYQNIDWLDKIREQSRKRVQKHRDKIKQLAQCNATCNVTGNVTVTPMLRNVTHAEREEDKEIEIEREGTTKQATADKPPEAEPTPYSEIKNLYLSLCPSFPRIQTLSANRKQAIHARWMQYGKSLDTFQQLFEKAESSAFLKGANSRNWSADFDWMLKDGNMAKILEGKYDSNPVASQGNATPNFSDPSSYSEQEEDLPEWARTSQN